MPPPLSEVGPGDPIPLDRFTWNAMIGAGRTYLRSRPGDDAPGDVGTPDEAQVLVRLRNDTGAPLPAFSVVAMGKPVVSPVDSPHQVRLVPVVPGTAPAGAGDAFAVTVDALDVGEIGRAAALGVVPCLLVVNSPTDTYASPAAGVTLTLSSGASGPARVVWAAGTTGTVWALVLLQGSTGAGAAPSCWKSPPARAKTTGALPSNVYANGTAGVGATLTATSNGALPAQDGVTLALGDTLLVDHEATAANNGIYTFTQLGDATHKYVLTRRGDANTGTLLLGAVVGVSEGSVNSNTGWECEAFAPITAGSTALAWQQVYPGGGNVITITDGTHTAAGIGTILFSPSGVFAVSGPSGGIGTLTMSAASATSSGYVNTTIQSFAGAKTFTATTVVAADFHVNNGGDVFFESTWAVNNGVVHIGYNTTAGVGRFRFDPLETGLPDMQGGTTASSGVFRTDGAGFFMYQSPKGYVLGTQTGPLLTQLIFAADALAIAPTNSSPNTAIPGKTGTDPIGNTFTGGLVTGIGPAAGISGTFTVKDSAGANHTVTVTGGIITSWV